MFSFQKICGNTNIKPILVLSVQVQTLNKSPMFGISLLKQGEVLHLLQNWYSYIIGDKSEMLG